jgi:ribosomal protein L11 methyltransferase
MKYLELIFLCRPAGDWQQDLLVDQLAAIGFDTFENTAEGFRAYIPEPNFNAIELETLLQGLDPAFEVSYEAKDIEPQNWNALWESNFQPIFIKDQVCVKATFHPSFPEYPIEILIDPKMAFGTGHHQTTSLVMEYILEESLEGKSVLDIGCGTGILGILASKLSAGNVLCIDNDPVCVLSARENQVLNSIDDMEVLEGSADAIPPRQFGIILANINRNILLDHLTHYARHIVEGGVLILSGFYVGEDLDLLKAEAQRCGFAYVDHKSLDNWAAAKFIFKR